MVEYYFGALAYAQLGSQLKDGQVYGDGIMSVLSDHFLAWPVCLEKNVETHDSKQNVWN